MSRDVVAVGFGIPCTIDRRTGVAVQSVHLPIVDVAFGAVMSERLGLPVSVDNDALRAVINDAATLPQVAGPLAVLAAWGVGTFALALKWFRWQ